MVEVFHQPVASLSPTWLLNHQSAADLSEHKRDPVPPVVGVLLLRGFETGEEPLKSGHLLRCPPPGSAERTPWATWRSSPSLPRRTCCHRLTRGRVRGRLPRLSPGVTPPGIVGEGCGTAQGSFAGCAVIASLAVVLHVPPAAAPVVTLRRIRHRRVLVTPLYSGVRYQHSGWQAVMFGGLPAAIALLQMPAISSVVAASPSMSHCAHSPVLAALSSLWHTQE